MQNLPTIEEMLKAGMHFGHRTSRWHPKMKPYIFGSRGGIHIIDLSISRDKLGEALEYMRKMTAENKRILFVCTKNQVKESLKETAIAAGMPYVCEKWLGGLLTNFTVIKKMIKKYRDIKEKKEAGKLDKYTKKERLEFDRELIRLDSKVGGLTQMDRLPDAIFIWDIKHEQTAYKEALLMKIPVIAVCDTNVNPEKVSYIIPSNDDATKSIALLSETIKQALVAARDAKETQPVKSDATVQAQQPAEARR